MTVHRYSKSILAPSSWLRLALLLTASFLFSPTIQPLLSQTNAQRPSGPLNALFLCNTMDANTATAIAHEISSVTNPAQQVRLAAYLVLTSSEYKVQHQVNASARIGSCIALTQNQTGFLGKKSLGNEQGEEE